MLEIEKQVAYVVSKDNAKHIALWTQYRVGGTSKTLIAVLKAMRMFFPRDKIGHGYKDSAFDVSGDHAQAWLNSKGYRVLSSMSDEG